MRILLGGCSRMVEKENRQSKYNAAIAQLYRIDNLWQSAHLNSRSGKLKEWNDLLNYNLTNVFNLLIN